MRESLELFTVYFACEQGYISALLLADKGRLVKKTCSSLLVSKTIPNLSDSTENYSRTSVARTLMARLPRLFRTRSWVPWKNPKAADVESFRVIFFFYVENTFIFKKIKKISQLSLLTWRYNQPSLARTSPVSI